MFHLSLLRSLASCGRGGIWRQKLDRPKFGGGDSELHNKPSGCGASEAYDSGPGREAKRISLVKERAKNSDT
jgi:hypothetical protein